MHYAFMTLIEFRKAKGWSQERLAQAIDPNGLGASLVSKWERGAVLPTLVYADRIVTISKGAVTIKDLIATCVRVKPTIRGGR
jgi:transcriptional regulator with XRE-family HTH domain